MRRVAAPRYHGGWQLHVPVGGMDRTAWVHQPAAGTGAAPPLVVCLHGGFGQGAGMALYSGFDRVADRFGFVVAYPDGHRRSWNDGRGNTPAGRDGVDDVAFAAALLDQLSTRLAYDPRRVYVTGISNGAMMAQRLGCELPERIAAIAPVAGGYRPAWPNGSPLPGRSPCWPCTGPRTPWSPTPGATSGGGAKVAQCSVPRRAPAGGPRCAAATRTRWSPGCPPGSPTARRSTAWP